MVNATEQLDQLAALADDDKPPDSGYSHHARIQRQDFDASSPRGVPHIAAADKDVAAAELNPAGRQQESLTARLLHTIAPAAAAGGGRPINRSSSLPNLERRRQQANATSDGGIAYEQHQDDAASFVSVEKAQRVHTFTGALPSEKSSTPVLAGILANNNGGGNGSPPIDATHQDGSTTPGPRPPLLSKKLLEPKKPLGKNPTFRQCLINVARYSWLNVLFVFVPVRSHWLSGSELKAVLTARKRRQVSWAMHFSHQSPTVTFCVSFFGTFTSSRFGVGLPY